MLVASLCPFPRAGSLAPVSGEVVGRFVPPACERCAGRRGITVAATPGAPVRATRDGAVTFAGSVGGSLWVVQQVAPGVRVTYGRLASIGAGVAVGETVTVGTPLATAARLVHLGVRTGDRYSDPLPCWAGRVALVAPPTWAVGATGVPR